MALLQIGTYIILVCALVANAEGQRLPSEDYFSVTVEPWGECRRINESRSCYRTRNAFCVRTTDDAIAPWYYCEENGLQRIPTVELCPPESCVQDCVVSVWSEWSECNCSASNYRSRCREIVVPPKNNGAECPQLLQNDTCNCRNTIDYLPRNYTWKLGKWGVCTLAVSTSSLQPHQCGHGLRNRSVQCVDLGDAVVNDSYCVMEEAYSHVLPPATTEFCEIPCPCVLGDWSDWGKCTPVCDTPTPFAEQRRERIVLQFPNSSGACEDTVETRECTFDSSSCPRYTWNTSDWSSCTFDGSGTCGIGLSQRYIYCLETLNGKTRSVNLDECDEHLSDPRPPNLDLCEITCPQNCVVGRWSAWSPCPRSCNLTYSNRTRNILIEPQGDGSECPHLIEYLQCPILPCVQWMTGEFSSCFPVSGSCGNGTKTRPIYCVDPSGMVIEYDNCAHLPQPGRSAFCSKPCANDCVISEWSTWSQCKQDCGRGYGIQTRTRRLLAYGTSPCLYDTANLVETRNCISDIPCSDAVYHIQFGEWDDCAIDYSGDVPPTLLTQGSTCGVGMQSRAAVCLKNDQVIGEDECPFTFQPIQTRRCNVSCSKACVVSEWEEFSPCSPTCGEGYRSRSRRLLEFSIPPDANCPADLNSHGIETEIMSCPVPACPADNFWSVQRWSECYTHPTALSKLSPDSVILRGVGSQQMQCGFGYQNRSVSCSNDRMEILSDHFCSHLLDSKPVNVQSCVVPCPDKCIISPWSEFGLCVNRALSRSRKIIPFSGSSDWRNDCPELVDVATNDSIPCSDDDTPYSWTTTSVWGECILDSSDAMCGPGFEYRSIVCIDIANPEKPVSEELCPAGTMPMSKRPCTVLCERDCILSDWSDYSECSVTSGYGYKSRMREILQSPQEGGRECGPLMEFSVCHIPPYEISHRYVVTTFGCLLENTSAVCGEGKDLRELVCLVNGVEQPDTSACSHNPPFRNHTCTLPCPGECVVSDWGPFSDCPDVCPTGQTCRRTRFRQILRDDNDCPSLVQNHPCDEFANPYVWMAQSWKECTITAAGSVSYCGNGFQERIIECTNILTNETVFDERCSDSGERPADVRACDIPCPVDCQVSPFSAWSECPSVCQFSPVQSRERRVVIQPRNGGRDCPSLHQERSCMLRNCDVYILQGYESRCYPVYTLNSTCGSVSSAAPISCLKNNRFVDIQECLDAAASGLEVIGATSDDLWSRSEGYCDLECPLEPECAFEDEWSEWSECQTLCHEPGTEGFSFRARKLLKAYERSRERCLDLQYEQMTCDQDVFAENETTTMPPTCLEFNWQNSVWNPDQSRTAWCQSSTGIEVANGCVESLRPVEQNGTCRSTCDGFFFCNVSSANCECSPLYEPVSVLCLPLLGCTLDSHCLYPDMVCDAPTRTCTCRAGTRLENEICVAIPTTVPTTLPTTATTAVTPTGSTPSTRPTTSDARPTTDGETVPPDTPTPETTAPTTASTPTDLSDTPTPSSSKGLGILPIVLAVVPVIIIIIIVLMLIAVMYRCRKQLEEKQKRERKTRVTISEPTPLMRLNNESAEEEHTDHSGMLRRGADSASSGFVDDVEHEMYKYGLAGRTFNDPAAQTMQALDIDEAAIRHNAQQYLPQHAQQFMPDGAQQYIPELQHQYLPDHAQHYDHVPYGASPSTRSHTPSPLPMSEMQSYHHHHHHQGEMHVDDRGGRGGVRIQHQVMGGMISGSEESRISHSSSSHYGRPGEFAYRGADNYDYLPPITHHPAHMMPNSYRDERIATGLDGPLVRAIEQLTSPGRPGDRSRSPSISSRSSGRASGRGSRRRRRPRVQGPGERVQHPTYPGPYPGPYPNSPPISSPVTPLSPYGPGSSPHITSSPYSSRRAFVYPSSSSPYHSTTASVHPASPQLSARNPVPYSPGIPHTSTPHAVTTTTFQPSSARMSARNVQRTPQNIYISNPYSGTTARVQPASPHFNTQNPSPQPPSTPHTSTTTPNQPSSPRMGARRTPQNIYISHPHSGTTAPASPLLNARNPAQHSLSNPRAPPAAPPPPPPPPPPPIRNESLGSHPPAPSQHLSPPGTTLSAPSQSPQHPRQPSPLVRHTYRDSDESYELELPQTFAGNPPSGATAVANFSRGVPNPMWSDHRNQA